MPLPDKLQLLGPEEDLRLMLLPGERADIRMIPNPAAYPLGSIDKTAL